MPWSTTRKPGTAAKYRTAEHRNLRAHYVRRIQAGEALECTAVECLFRSRAITNVNGNDSDGLNLGHNDDGVTYRGPEHRACNVKDGSRRGNARSHGKAIVSRRRWVL